MLMPFFGYLLSCVGADGFTESINTVTICEERKTTPIMSVYVKVSDLPFGHVNLNKRRYAGTIISLKCQQVAEYPFPARINEINNGSISVSWNDILGRKFNAILDPDDEIRIDILKDRSPEAIAIRDAERKFLIKEQLRINEIEKEHKHKHLRFNIRKLARDLSRRGISSSIIDGKVAFCDKLYFVDYSPESDEFEISRNDGVYIAKFSSDERGMSRMIRNITRLESQYNPEEHVTRITGINDRML